MKTIIKIILKLIASVIAFLIWYLHLLIMLIMWNSSYFEYADNSFADIWKITKPKTNE